VKDAHVFSDSVNSSTFFIVYSNTTTKAEILALLKASFTTIDRIGFVFASNMAIIKTFLENEPFFSNDDLLSNPHSENLEFIISILKEFSVKNIDFLACDTLNYPDWVNYYNILETETGVTVGASNDKTGNIKYGGDWIMESTSQDIENCYFTSNIEYYTYLLDSGVWSLTSFPIQLSLASSVVNNNYVYVIGGTSAGNNKKTVYYAQLDSSGSVGTWNTTTEFPFTVAYHSSVVHNNFIYVFSGFIGSPLSTSIYYAQINNDGTIGQWVDSTTKLPAARGTASAIVNNGYVYIIGGYNSGYGLTNTVFRAKLNSNGSIGSFTTSYLPISVYDATTVVNGNNLYLIGGGGVYPNTFSTVYYAKLNIDGSIGTWNLTTSFPTNFQSGASIVNKNYIFVFGGGNSTTVLDTVYYAAVNPDGSVKTWNVSSISPFPISVTWPSMIVNQDYIHVIGGRGSTGNDYNTVYSIDFPTLPVIKICFPAGTPILTDQGKIPIDKLDPDIHTINKKRILKITKTTTTDKYLVEIKKNAFGTNYPTQNTQISFGHKLMYSGQMCTAKSLLHKNKDVVKVKYTGEFLYNVLMEEYSTMNVNNLTCETLHPENPIARLYN
jgi:N-acetylneuraminic acid mutarotase